MAESEEELKSLWIRVKEESERAGLKQNTKKTKIMSSGPIVSWQIEGENVEVVTDFLFWGSKITADVDCCLEIRRCLLLGRKAMTNLDSVLKSRDITLPTKVHIVKAMVFPVVTHGCESWKIKKAEHWRTDAFELWCWRTLESPLECKEIQPVSPKGNQPWIFIGRTDAEAEARILWPPDMKSQFSVKYPDAGEDWRQEEKGTTEDEMAGWHHRCNGHELGQTLGYGEGQRGLVCYTPWGHKELDMTRWLNNNNLGFNPWVKKIPWRRKSHSCILAWKILWMGSLASYSPWGCKELDTTEHAHSRT